MPQLKHNIFNEKNQDYFIRFSNIIILRYIDIY